MNAESVDQSPQLWPLQTALVCLAILVLSVVLGLVAGVASQNAGSQVPRGSGVLLDDPERVVIVWDRSFRAGDCEAFRDTTTDSFRADYGQARADYSTCAGFRDGIKEVEHGKPDDFWRTYEIEILDVDIDGDVARVETEETWEYLDDRGRVQTTSERYTYDLVRTGGQWRIDDASFLRHDDEIEV